MLYVKQLKYFGKSFEGVGNFHVVSLPCYAALSLSSLVLIIIQTHISITKSPNHMPQNNEQREEPKTKSRLGSGVWTHQSTSLVDLLVRAI
jgi:hypothetical protein